MPCEVSAIAEGALERCALPPKADMCSALGDVCFGLKADIPTKLYGGRPASRQAFVRGSASAGTIPRPVQVPDELKEGCSASACLAAALASSARPSFASAAASRQ